MKVLNLTNPAGTIKSILWNTSNLQELTLLYTNGLVYSNGNFSLNINNPSLNSSNWEWSLLQQP